MNRNQTPSIGYILYRIIQYLKNNRSSQTFDDINENLQIQIDNNVPLKESLIINPKLNCDLSNRTISFKPRFVAHNENDVKNHIKQWMDGITMEDLVEAHRNAYNVVDGLVDRDQAYCLIEDKLVKKKGNSFKLIKQNQLNIIELPDVIIFPNIYDKPIQTNDNLRNMWNQSKIPLFSDIQEALRDSELISYSHYDRQRMMREGMMDVKKKKKKRSISGRRQMKITNVHMIDKIVGLMNKKQPGQ